MTAEASDDQPPGAPRLGSDGWLREKAAHGPRPLRVFFEAELGFRGWLPSAGDGLRRAGDGAAAATRQLSKVTVVQVDGRVSHPTRLATSPELQARLARRLTPVVVTLGVLGLATSVNLRTTNETLIVERLAQGGKAQAEALAALHGTEALRTLKGLAVEQAAPAAGEVARAITAAAPGGTAGAAVDRTVPARRGALPVGKGMWIWLADKAEGGNVEAIVARARAVGLTHLYVRTASLREGFYAGPFLDRLLPAAHAANIRVYAWDFPYLTNVDADVQRALKAITYLTPDGHRVDGYVADIELQSMGVNVTPATGKHFGVALRRAVGPNYPLIACVPRPSPALKRYPFADVVAAFDAIAPMVYWMHRDPVDDITGALRDLSVFGKPIIPAGQAYDGQAEGGPPGVPPREQLIRFMQAGDRLGAPAVSWWSWQHADQQAWDAIRDAGEFRLPTGDPAAFTAGQVYAYQTLLSSLGFTTPIDGRWQAATEAAVREYQQAARLPETGVIDEATRDVMLTPVAPPIEPQP